MARRIEAVRSTLPVVAIVGRPNVGKSTFFNRLVGAKRAIVDDAPGVTRDRLMVPARHEDRAFLLVDTGGFEADASTDDTAMAAHVRRQALEAIKDAQAIICVVDGPAGLGPADRELLRLVQTASLPLFVAVNKIDSPSRDGLLYDFFAAGIEQLFPISAAHGHGIDALMDAVVATLAPTGAGGATAGGGTRLAFIGRPNAGKSSLVNRLLGMERTIVSPEAGTTRDAIDTAITVDDTPYVLIDTAGIRRRSRIKDPLEGHGAVRALGTIERTDIALVVLDANEGLSDQDAHIVARAWDAGRGVILLFNKIDTLPPERRTRAHFERLLANARPAFANLPVLCVSAHTGDGLDGLFPLVARVARSMTLEMATPRLNTLLRRATDAVAPPSGGGGKPIRLLYAAQTGRRPPEITIFSSAPAKISVAYTRYLTSGFAEAFRIVGVPLRIKYRSRRDTPTGRARTERIGQRARTR